MINYIISKLLWKIKPRIVYKSILSKKTSIGGNSWIISSSISDYTYCGYDCKIFDCIIGKYTSIGNNVQIGIANHPINDVSTSPVFYSNKNGLKVNFGIHKLPLPPTTTIGNDVWIGTGALVKAGVTIGDGAIIGMGAVVTKNIGPYEVWAGNPAKIIKKRFDDDTINKILSSKWWSLPEARLKDLATDFNNPQKMLDKL